jgi:signal peptide peptidase SppA
MITETAFSGLATALIGRMNSPRAAATPDQLPDGDYLAWRKRMQATDSQARLDDVYSQRGNTAIITLDGVIDRHLSSFEMECYGGCDLADIDRAIALAASDPTIRNVVLELRSPGGSVIGVAETAQQVANLGRTKNVYAFTDSVCASAAYYIASQAHQIFSTSSAVVGSIGVYCAILDASGWYEAQNLKVNFFKDGDFKGAGLDFKPLSDAEATMFQDRVLQLGAMFRDAVTSMRPQVSLATMQGQSFVGCDTSGNGLDALQVGLVDGVVLSLEELLARI